MKNSLSIPIQVGLKNPGDNLTAKITQNGNKVIKMSKNNGASKYAAVQYKNGTIVETKSTKVN